MATRPATRTPAAKAKSTAESAYDRITLYIRSVEAQLNADQEVAMGFAGSEAGILHIDGLGFFAPDNLSFYGPDDAGPNTQSIQRVRQLSVMLRACPKADTDDAPRCIGFRLAAGWNGGESGAGSD
jgi:hypothetical protein